MKTTITKFYKAKIWSRSGSWVERFFSAPSISAIKSEWRTGVKCIQVYRGDGKFSIENLTESLDRALKHNEALTKSDVILL